MAVTELEIIKQGDMIILRPVQSLADLPKADADFLQDRLDVIDDDGRVSN